MGNSEQPLKPNLVQKQSLLRIYNILAIPSVLCGCEIWTLKQWVIRRLKTAEMKFMSHIEIYTLVYIRRYEDILEELRVSPLKEQYEHN
jgi:hypothetical protein